MFQADVGSPTLTAGTHDGESPHVESINILRNVSAPRLSATPYVVPSAEVIGGFTQCEGIPLEALVPCLRLQTLVHCLSIQ